MASRSSRLVKRTACGGFAAMRWASSLAVLPPARELRRAHLRDGAYQQRRRHDRSNHQRLSRRRAVAGPGNAGREPHRDRRPAASEIRRRNGAPRGPRNSHGDERRLRHDPRRQDVPDPQRDAGRSGAGDADDGHVSRATDARKEDLSRVFCENLHCIGESRIMTNFDGSFNQMITLSHELGHGYHGECLTEAKLLNSDYPMPLAETASIFCETIVKNAAIKESNKEEAFAILEQELQDCSQVIVDILSRYIFETNVMERRENGPLSADEFKEIMINAQKEAYGDGLDPEKLHPYMWVCKGHYYSADFNFYNFPYAFGLLFAKGLYAEYLKKGDEFVEAYDKLLLATGKNNIADVAATMGIDVRNPDFWRSSLKIIAGDIEKFCKK